MRNDTSDLMSVRAAAKVLGVNEIKLRRLLKSTAIQADAKTPTGVLFAPATLERINLFLKTQQKDLK